MMRRYTTKDLTMAAILAAVYAVLTVTLPIPQYGSIQVRLAEAFTVLPFLFPAATPGLVVWHRCHFDCLYSDRAYAQPLAGSFAPSFVQRCDCRW